MVIKRQKSALRGVILRQNKCFTIQFRKIQYTENTEEHKINSRLNSHSAYYIVK